MLIKGEQASWSILTIIFISSVYLHRQTNYTHTLNTAEKNKKINSRQTKHKNTTKYKYTFNKYKTESAFIITLNLKQYNFFLQ